jgi:hypothetical protein
MKDSSGKQQQRAPINLTKDVRDHILYTKRMLETTKDRGFSMGDTVMYALDFLIKNDKDLYNLNRTLMYNVEKGRLRELYE